MDKYKQKLEKIAYDKATYEKISAIADKYSLHIDQLGELTAEIRDVLMGFRPSKNFTADIIERLEIDSKIANDITADANIIISEIMKDQIQPQTTDNSSAISSLEKLGGFSIEKSEGNTNNENSTVTYEPVSDVSEADRQSILYGIENPVGAKVASTPNIQVKQEESIHTDPLIDHLLANPVSTTEKKVEQTAKPIDSQKPRGSDAYREPLN